MTKILTVVSKAQYQAVEVTDGSEDTIRQWLAPFVPEDADLDLSEAKAGHLYAVRHTSGMVTFVNPVQWLDFEEVAPAFTVDPTSPITEDEAALFAQELNAED